MNICISMKIAWMGKKHHFQFEKAIMTIQLKCFFILCRLVSISVIFGGNKKIIIIIKTFCGNGTYDNSACLIIACLQCAA